MAAGITDRDTMAYAEESAWHGMGLVTGKRTMRELFEDAELGFEVVKKPVEYNGIAVPGSMFTVREDTNEVLGIVGEGYEVFNNYEGLDWLESLWADGVFDGATAGTLFGGKQVYMSAKLTEDMRIGDDLVEQYMLLRLGHDGNTTIDGTPTTIRPVCANTVTAAIANAKADRHFRIKHTRNLDLRLEEAREALQVTVDFNKRLAEWSDKASVTPMSDVDAFVSRLFGDASTQAINKSEKFVDEFLMPEVYHSGRNLLAGWNAVTGWGNHGMSYRERANSEPMADRRLDSIVDGPASEFMRKGRAVIDELITA